MSHERVGHEPTRISHRVEYDSFWVADIEESGGDVSNWKKELARNIRPEFLPFAARGLQGVARAITNINGLEALGELQGSPAEHQQQPHIQPSPLLSPDGVGVNPDVLSMVPMPNSLHGLAADMYNLMGKSDQAIAAAQGASLLYKYGSSEKPLGQPNGESIHTMKVSLSNDLRKAFNSIHYPTNVSLRSELNGSMIQFSSEVLDTNKSRYGEDAFLTQYATISDRGQGIQVNAGIIYNHSFVHPTNPHSKPKEFARLIKGAVQNSQNK